jgi:hypothetical protein
LKIISDLVPQIAQITQMKIKSVQSVVAT